MEKKIKSGIIKEINTTFVNHQELIDNIEGSILKQQYLEAFLLQGTYVEGLLKMRAQLAFYFEIEVPQKDKDSLLVKEIKKNVLNYNFYKLIEFLKKSGVISDSLAKDLDNFREKRNKIVHDLLTEMYSRSFQIELKDICALGKKIVTSDEFEDVVSFVEKVDKRITDALAEKTAKESIPPLVPPGKRKNRQEKEN